MLERMWEKVVVAHFKVVSQHLSGRAEENYKISQSGYPVPARRFEARIWSRSANITTVESDKIKKKYICFSFWGYSVLCYIKVIASLVDASSSILLVMTRYSETISFISTSESIVTAFDFRSDTRAMRLVHER
jgi:hypothetical protein